MSKPLVSPAPMDDIVIDSNAEALEPAAVPRTASGQLVTLEIEFPESIPDTLPARLKLFREALKAIDQQLVTAFDNGAGGRAVVRGRARLVDDLMTRAWSLYIPDTAEDISLVAVGGYGRGELHPGSDLDIQILVTESSLETHKEALEQFLTFLWDIGLAPGQSVRTVADCEEQAKADITVMTNLLEARMVSGSDALFEQMQTALAPEKLWSAAQFFAAKREEQEARHNKFHDSSYRIEPNLKESPGGLRDLQMIGWVARRYFNNDLLSELLDENFLTKQEFEQLIECRSFLWRVRFALHTEAGRGEDRLLFDLQLKLAERLGYMDGDRQRNEAVEAFMQDYFRNIVRINRLNEMLLQLFDERILGAGQSGPIKPLNKRFQLRGGFLEAIDNDVFQQRPLALLEVFHLMQLTPEARGVRASTIRLIRANRHLIDDEFRADLRAKSLFMEMLRQPRGITHEFRRMNRYGVLARYIPAFRNIVGRMQFDMFHVYTVDEHILMVLRNLRHAACPEYAHELPFVSEITLTAIPKLELLYLAGLFHDIGKGRQGDHSELGAVDALEFCLDHGLSEHDAGLVSWLVRHHLTMSVTAQRKDISDPDVIHEFAITVGSEMRLNYLFLLTVADIRGTNPELWNSWRESLLHDLYRSTRAVLRRGLDKAVAPAELIADTKLDALYRLQQAGLAEHKVQGLWQRLGSDYFLRHQADEVAWHTQALMNHDSEDGPLVLLKESPNRGGSTLFVWMTDAPYLFGYTAAALNHLQLNIVDARVHSTPDGFTMDSYVLLEADGSPITGPERQREIVHKVRERLARFNDATAREWIDSVQEPLARRVRAFQVPTEIRFATEASGQRTAVELYTADRPGLLALVGQAFAEHDLVLHTAKIATLGEKVEDVFFVTDIDGNALTDLDKQNALRERLCELLEDH